MNAQLEANERTDKSERTHRQAPMNKRRRLREISDGRKEYRSMDAFADPPKRKKRKRILESIVPLDVRVRMDFLKSNFRIFFSFFGV